MAFSFEDAELFGNDGLSVTSIPVSVLPSLKVSKACAKVVDDTRISTSPHDLKDGATEATEVPQQAELLWEELENQFTDGESKGEYLMELDDILGIEHAEIAITEAVMLDSLADIEGAEIEVAEIEVPQVMQESKPPMMKDDLLEELLAERKRLELKQKENKENQHVHPRSGNVTVDQIREMLARTDRLKQVTDKWVQLRNKRLNQPEDPEMFEGNKKKLLQLAEELNAAFGEDSFQLQIQALLDDHRNRRGLPQGAPIGFAVGRKSLVRSVQDKILPVYGFSGQLGVYSMLLSLEAYCDDNEMLGSMQKTDRLLGLPSNSTLYSILDAGEKFSNMLQ